MLLISKNAFSDFKRMFSFNKESEIYTKKIVYFEISILVNLCSMGSPTWFVTPSLRVSNGHFETTGLLQFLDFFFLTF